MLVAPFHPAHLVEIRAQPRQPKDLMLYSDPSYGESLAEGQAFSVFDSGGLKACLGVVDMGTGRGLGWAVLSCDLKALMAPMTLRARQFFRESAFRRVEAYIDPNFPQAIRWAGLLGFEREGLMKCFTPSGADQYLYARIR